MSRYAALKIALIGELPAAVTTHAAIPRRVAPARMSVTARDVMMLLVALSACLPVLVRADVPESQRAEVDHLLAYILETDCEMVRNGRAHAGEQAHAHVLKKYDYFRNRIESTEQFIELSASRSTMSGRPYTISCDGAAAENTRDWLLRELYRWRESQGGG